jgi:phosphate starvation-inducible membrane PsiE
MPDDSSASLAAARAPSARRQRAFTRWELHPVIATSRRKPMKYSRFGLMILASTTLMFGLMYLNNYALDHIYFSETRFYMSLVMGASMAVVMLLFMLTMYSKKTANAAILAAAVLTFSGALWLVRSQSTVEDVSWMKAMIPHHSIAILTSSRAEISDPRVRDLADRIIKAQESEIAEMKKLIAELEAE